MELSGVRQQYAALQPQIDAAVFSVLQSGVFVGGEQVAALERRLAGYVGVRHCISCASGTDALALALRACRIGAGDAVFVPDFTFFATAEAVAAAGATPVFVDVCPVRMTMSPERLSEAIRRVESDGRLRPAAVIPVDLFGRCADYPALLPIAERHRLTVIEDAAQGFGAELAGQRAGSFGRLAALSFFPTKPLGCYGDGGAVLTDDDEAAALIRSLAVHGRGAHKYDNLRIGVNSRLDAIQAAILDVKLDAFERHERLARQKAAENYNILLKRVNIIPSGNTDGCCWAQYTVRFAAPVQRNAAAAALSERGIPSAIYYPKPLHRQTAFAGYPVLADCPVSDALCETVLSLPMHPYLTEEEQQQVADTILSGIQL